MRVVFFHRKPLPRANFSIEKIFGMIRNKLPCEITHSTVVMRYYSRGIFKRLYSCGQAYWNQADVNHITGDIHFVALLLRKRRTILTIHDIGWMDTLPPVSRLLFKWLWIVMPVKRSALITTVSETTKTDLLKHVSVNPSQIRVIYNPIFPWFQHSPKSFNEGEPVILLIGTKPNKNLSRVIRALKGLSCKLQIVGKLSSDDEQGLRESGLSYTVHNGVSDEEIYDLYRLADIVSLVSLYEGFGMPIIEGNAVGRVVVTSNCSSMPEVAGGAAHLVDPFDVDSIREGFIKIMKDKNYREELIKKGLENIKRFEPDEIASQYALLYTQIDN